MSPPPPPIFAWRAWLKQARSPVWARVVTGEPAHGILDYLQGNLADRSWLWVMMFTGADGRGLVSALRPADDPRHPVCSLAVSGLGDLAIWLPDTSTLGVVVGDRGYKISLASRVLPGSRLEDACIEIAKLVMS